MHIGILGGAYNPPHLGHILIVQQVLSFTDVQQVWFLPSFKLFLPAYKNRINKDLVSVKHRLNMIRLLQLPKTQVSTLEIDYQLNGNTINLIPLLKKHYTGKRFSLIIGSDWLPNFHKWGRWQTLLRQIPFIVVPRAGFPPQPLYPNMQLLKHPLLVTTNISSSIIRDRVKQKLPIDYLVTPEVAKHIKRHKLYQ